MSNLEKINIYVPAEIGDTLDKDASLFEVVKKDGYSINRNRFLNMIIKGYYNDYYHEYQQAMDQVEDRVRQISDDESGITEISERIVKDILMPSIPKRKGKKPIKMSLKPVAETEGIIMKMLQDIGGEDYISQYICRILVSYCNKGIADRERLVFKNNYSLLNEAIKNNKTVSISLKWNKSRIHDVIPYEVVASQEEMLNYLLCGEVNSKNGKIEARTYRLCRISSVDYSNKSLTISDELNQFLDEMKRKGAQFAINSNAESCIRLTDYGVKLYNRIYTGRPIVDKRETVEGGQLLYCHVSEDQLFTYFRRFGKEAQIIYPEGLKTRILDFYKQAISAYETW